MVEGTRFGHFTGFVSLIYNTSLFFAMYPCNLRFSRKIHYSQLSVKDNVHSGNRFWIKVCTEAPTLLLLGFRNVGTVWFVSPCGLQR
jgi:hypothetical protein